MRKIRLDRKKLDYVMLMRDVPSYRELARRAAVHPNTLNNLVNHERYSMNLLAKVAEVLRVNPLDLLKTEGFPEPILVADREWDRLFADPRTDTVLVELVAEAEATPEDELVEGW